MGFSPGLTVITGETGSGKSILVHALQLVLGGRARPDVVRTGERQAEVEALFEVGDDARIQERLTQLGLPAEDDLVVRRVVQAGRSRATVNGHLTTAGQLRTLAAGLVDISSQHEHQTLADPTTHMDTLDAWADPGALAAEVRDTYAQAVAALDAVSSLREKVAEGADRIDLLRFQLEELDRLDPQPGELKTLEEQIGRLGHTEALRRLAGEAEFALYSRDRSVCGEVAAVEASLTEATGLDPALAPLLAQVTAARVELEDVGAELSRYTTGLDADPEHLATLQDRLHGLRRIARRFSGGLGAAVAHRDAAHQELSVLEDAGAHLDKLQEEADAALRRAGNAAKALSAARHEAAHALGAAIGSELADLGMGEAKIHIQVAPQPGLGGLSVDGVRLTPRGLDRVELLISPNPGETPRPLKRIASGGELSRALLATKRVLAGLGPVGTYIFDEVDAGVGGAVAESIGLKLAEVAAHHQVLCITHLPQIAALGAQHLRVTKQVSGGRTRSALVPLTADDRVEELARMLGGRTVTAAAREAARALLR